MKKWISVGVALVMLFTLAVPTFAESTKISTKNTTVQYQISYPSDTEIAWEAGSQVLTNPVKATKLLIEPGKSVRVSVTSNNGFKMVNTADPSKSIVYTLTGAENIVFNPGEVGKSYPITVNVAPEQWQQASAGEHTDILTFVVAY